MNRANQSLLIALAAGAPALTLADDTSDSVVFIDKDDPEQFAAGGFLVFKDTTTPVGINTELGQVLPPTRVEFFDDDPNWKFYLAALVSDWDIPWTLEDDDGAYNVRLALWGEHVAHPHENWSNDLPEVITGRGTAIEFSIPDVQFAQVSQRVSVAGADAHEDHMDWYSAKMDCHAYSNYAPNIPAVWGLADVHAIHSHTPGQDFSAEPDHNTMGASPTQGSQCVFDPDSGTLLLQMGAVDILDADGGRSGGIDPGMADDPLVGAAPEPVILRYSGFDPERAEHVFQGGQLTVSAPDAPVAIDADIGELRISGTLPGSVLANYAWFESLSVVDSGDPEGPSSAWATRFVDDGWFGEELSTAERAKLVYPVLTFSTDLDLVEATHGFTQPAALPATVLLTIATNPDAEPLCPADLTGDGAADFNDVIAFLTAFSEADPAADLFPDGQFDITDVIAFLTAFSNGCP